MKSAYIRASCPYQMISGATVAKPAATRPVLRSKSSRPVTKSTGIRAALARIDGPRMASSPSPNNLTVNQRMR
jgi:hypothetical protein